MKRLLEKIGILLNTKTVTNLKFGAMQKKTTDKILSIVSILFFIGIILVGVAFMFNLIWHFFG